MLEICLAPFFTFDLSLRSKVKEISTTFSHSLAE